MPLFTRFPRRLILGNSAVVLSCVAYRPRSTYVATQDKASFREARMSETRSPTPLHHYLSGKGRAVLLRELEKRVAG